jgi:peptidoglycan biosynthesis protein MviN/MurJ (putative lipid II flippase)
MFISAFILIIFYLIDLLKPPFYSADEMENPFVFFTPILVIGVTIYILIKLYLNELILFMLLLTLFIIDMILSYKRAKD